MDPAEARPEVVAPRASVPFWFKLLLFSAGFLVGYFAMGAGFYLGAIWDPLGWVGPLVLPGLLGWILWRRGWRAVALGMWIGAPLQFAVIVWLTSQVVPNWPD